MVEINKGLDLMRTGFGGLLLPCGRMLTIFQNEMSKSLVSPAAIVFS